MISKRPPARVGGCGVWGRSPSRTRSVQLAGKLSFPAARSEAPRMGIRHAGSAGWLRWRQGWAKPGVRAERAHAGRASTSGMAAISLPPRASPGAGLALCSGEAGWRRSRRSGGFAAQRELRCESEVDRALRSRRGSPICRAMSEAKKSRR